MTDSVLTDSLESDSESKLAKVAKVTVVFTIFFILTVLTLFSTLHPRMQPEIVKPETPVFSEDFFRIHKVEPEPTTEDLLARLRELEDVTEDEDPRLDLINAYVHRGVNPNEKGTSSSPTFVAATKWMLPVLKRIHSLKGIDFNANVNQWTIMHAVVMNVPITEIQKQQADATIKFLVSIGGDIEALAFSFTPLMQAINNGNLEIAQILLLNGANPNGPFQEKRFIFNPLILAVRRKNFEMVKLLTRHDADIMAYNKYGKSALQEAAIVGFTEALRWFIEESQCDRNTRVPQLTERELSDLTESEKDRLYPGASLKYLASVYGNSETVQYLGTTDDFDSFKLSSYPVSTGLRQKRIKNEANI